MPETAAPPAPPAVTVAAPAVTKAQMPVAPPKPDAPPPASVTGAADERDAADTKAWKEITGEEPGSNDIPIPDFAKLAKEGKVEATPRGDDGKFVKGVKTAAEESAGNSDKTDEAKSKDDAKGSPAAPQKPMDRDQRRKLLAAQEVVARVLKWDEAKIEATDPQQLIDLGQSLKPVFGVVESLKTDLQKWKDKARGQKPHDLDTPDDGPGRTGDPVDKADSPRAERDGVGYDKLLRDYLDPDTLTQVRDGMRAERAKFQDQAMKASERAEAAETRLKEAKHLALLDRIDVARERVAEKFPQLNDDKRFDEILNLMDELDPAMNYRNGDQKSFTRFMEKICKSEFFEDVERTTRERLITGNRKDVNGQPETTSHGSQPSAMTWDEFDNYALWAAQEAGGNKSKHDALMARVKKPARPK